MPRAPGSRALPAPRRHVNAPAHIIGWTSLSTYGPGPLHQHYEMPLFLPRFPPCPALLSTSPLLANTPPQPAFGIAARHRSQLGMLQ